ncbi:MAG: tyrosine-type recombinase/integrase [Actinomycetota bacterium]|nr:site-specific integrase [Actinomycetota bacterium]
MAHIQRTEGKRGTRYEVRYRAQINGRWKWRGKTFARKEDARSFLATVSADIVRGDFIDPKRAETRFRDVAEAWRSTLSRDRKEKTIRVYESDLRVHVSPSFGDMSVGAITYADIDAWIRSMEAKGSRPGTIRNAYKVVKQVLDYAVKDGRLRSNPCAGVTLPKAANVEMLFLSAEQVATLAAEVPVRYQTLVRFAAYTGLRAGEITALRMKDVDWKTGDVRVTKTLTHFGGTFAETEPKTKAGRRTVTMPRFVFEELKTFVGDRKLDRAAYVFGTATPMRHGNFYRRHFRPAVLRAFADRPDLQPLRFHDLRHTFASFLVAQGAHPKEMAELMGHSSVQITLDRYSHVMPHLGAALAERLDDAYADAKPTRQEAHVLTLR